MISSEVQRTLVKSPPELWAELSDPTALARHLGELGEIRIVRVEPERTVEWAAENTTGTVSIKPSGWGTNVKLTVMRELAEPEPVAVFEPQPEAVVEPQATVAREPEPEAALEPRPQTSSAPEPPAVQEPTPDLAAHPGEAMAVEQAVEPKPRRGFLARLFGRRRTSVAPVPTPEPPVASPAVRPPEPPDPFAAVRAALAPESFAAAHLFAAPPSALPATKPAADGPHEAAEATADKPTAGVEQAAGERGGEADAPDISAELMAAEEVAEEEVTAVLTAVLDRLGAAHHRPFSRA